MERSFDWLWDKYKEGARDKLEEICYKIYKNEHPNAEVKRVRVHHGDGGIDVYIDYGERYIVAQCKFFRYEVGKSQKNQIISSFKSVDKDDLNEWILCIPIVMDNKEASWWRKWKKRNEEEFGIVIKLHDEDDLIDLLKKYDLYDQYFNTIRIDKDFIDTVVGNDEKKKVHDRLYPLVSEIAGVDYDMYDIINKVANLADLRAHRLFLNNNLLNSLDELAQLYSFHAEGPNIYGRSLRDEEIIKIETGLRKRIVKEYKKLKL